MKAEHASISLVLGAVRGGLREEMAGNDFPIKGKELSALLLYLLSGILFALLFIESICSLLQIYIFPIYSGFFYEVGKIFRAKPTLIPISFILFFVTYIMQGVFTFSEVYRNKTLATAALGFVSFSSVILIYTFWELILTYPVLIFGIFVVLALIYACYFMSPWKEWMQENIYRMLNEAEKITDDYLSVLNDAKLIHIPHLFQTIEEYKKEIKDLRKKMEGTNANLKLIEMESKELLRKVKSGPINEIEDEKKSIIREIKNYLDALNLRDDEKIILLFYYLPPKSFKILLKEKMIGGEERQ